MMQCLKVTSFLITAAVLLASCIKSPASTPISSEQTTPTQVEIPFRIVDQADPLGDRPEEAVYAVITTQDDWVSFDARVPPGIITTGKIALQSDPAVYLLAYAGVRGSSGYMLDITSIRLVKDQYFVEVTETRPTIGTIVEPAKTLPYVLAAISWNDLPRNEELIFIFTDPQGSILGQGETRLP